MVWFDDTRNLPVDSHAPRSIAESSLHDAARHGATRAAQWLMDHQDPDGFWCGELEGDSILQSEYVLLLAWLEREQSSIAQKCARHLVRQQLPEGGWAMYPGGEVDVSGSVKAYFALKLTGHDPEAEPMRRARAAILMRGGADIVNSFTRFYLALLGQISYDHCPAVPPEMVLLPTWQPVNIYRISAWSRTIFVPLSIMWAHRPIREIPEARGIQELMIQSPDAWPPLRCPGRESPRGPFTWESFFRAVDWGLRFCERHRLRPLRRWAIRAAEKWMTDRFVGSDGLGAIFPPIIWSIVALKCLGYSEQSAEMRYCHEQLEALMIEEDGTIRLQPCKSPVWDTALTLRALTAAGIPTDNPIAQQGARWLLDKEVTRPGDWSQYVKAETSGWFFEHHNEFYPDVDDTTMVLMALREQFHQQLKSHVRHHPDRVARLGWLQLRKLQPDGADFLSFLARERASSFQEVRTQIERLDRTAAACRRGVKWVLAMQNSDGGWGAFDRNNDHEFLCHVPFADHNAMIDPSTPDITGRALEMLGHFNYRHEDQSLRRAVDYLRRTQESDGSWFGRWGVNYIYGTWQVLAGLAAVGVPGDDAMMVRGASWLVEHQQPSGGWGESPDSYAEPRRKGQGIETPSQTAWALLGLMAAGMRGHVAVTRGIKFLIDRQGSDGTWDETQFTGTGFPRVFYLRYHLYPLYFPLLAIGKWTNPDRE